MTTIVNSIYNHLAFRICWQLAGLDLDHFDEDVFLVTYGDDNVVNVSDRAIEFFNQNSVIALMPQLGLTYTSERKDEVVVPNYRTITEVGFLKRGFRYDESHQRWVSPLEMATILQMPYWLHKNPDLPNITLTVFEKALQELAQHGE